MITCNPAKFQRWAWQSAGTLSRPGTTRSPHPQRRHPDGRRVPLPAPPRAVAASSTSSLMARSTVPPPRPSRSFSTSKPTRFRRLRHAHRRLRRSTVWASSKRCIFPCEMRDNILPHLYQRNRRPNRLRVPHARDRKELCAALPNRSALSTPSATTRANQSPTASSAPLKFASSVPNLDVIAKKGLLPHAAGLCRHQS